MPLKKKSNISIERFDAVFCVLRQNCLKAYRRVVSREALAGTKIAGTEYRAALLLGAGWGWGFGGHGMYVCVDLYNNINTAMSIRHNIEMTESN